MRRAPTLILLAAIAVGCASSARGRAMQYAEGIKSAQRQTVTALDFDLISAETGEWLQVATRTATEDLKRVVAAIKAEAEPKTVDRLLDIVYDGLLAISKKLQVEAPKK